MSTSKLILLFTFLSALLYADGWNLDISNNTIYPGNSGNKVLVGGAPQIDGVPLVIKNALAIYGSNHYTEFFVANQAADIFYQLPSAQGTGQLTNDGSGNLSWASGGSSGLTSINSDSTAAQTIGVGTSGTDFAIVDGGSGAHTLNLPSASATARGVVTTGTQTLAGAKTFSTAPKFSSFSTATPLFTSATGQVSQDANITWDATNSLLVFTNPSGLGTGGLSFASGPMLTQTSSGNPNILNWLYNNNTAALMTWRNPTGVTRAILEMDDPNGTYFQLINKTGTQNMYMEVTPAGTEQHLSASGTLGLQIAGVTKATLNSSGQFNLPALTASSVVVTDSSKNLASSAVTSATLAFLDATSSVQTQLNAKQGLDATLTSLAAYNTNGIVTQTAADTFTGRTITGTSNQITVTNGDGVSGNPTLATPQNIHTGASPTFVTETLSGLTASRAVVTDGSKVLTSATTTAAEVDFLSGVTSAIQTQLNTKRPIYDVTSAIGNCGSSQTVDLSLYNTFTTTLNAATCTFTFSNPTAGGTWLFILTEDGTGGRAVAFVSTVNFPGITTTPPTLSGASRRDQIKIHYDGTNYDASYILNY